MHKKLIMACMAIAAFAAFVVAPAASASPVLTSESKTVPVHNAAKTCTEDGTGCIVATNTGVTKFTASTGAVIECATARLTGYVTENSGTKIKGTIPVNTPTHEYTNFNGTAGVPVGQHGGDCTSTQNLGPIKPTVTSELCLETVAATDNVTVTGCGGAVKFTLDITNLNLECKYSTASVSGTYKTNAEATVNVSEQKATREGTNFLCPESGKLDMDFDLYTDTANNTEDGILTVS